MQQPKAVNLFGEADGKAYVVLFEDGSLFRVTTHNQAWERLAGPIPPEVQNA